MITEESSTTTFRRDLCWWFRMLETHSQWVFNELLYMGYYDEIYGGELMPWERQETDQPRP